MSNPQMFCADSRNLGELSIDPGSVDCIITSPPYWDLKRYGDIHDEEIGHKESTYADYVTAVGDVLGQCAELATPDGVLWLVADTVRDRGGEKQGTQLPLPFDLAEEAARRGWRLQETIVWKKNKTLPYSGEGKLRNLLEYVLFFTRTRKFKHYPHRLTERHLPKAEWLAGWPERYHPLGRRPSNFWDIPIPTQGMWAHSDRLHFCPFPQDLVARCIELTTDKGDIVLDPFAGVGTVPAQAVAMGRNGIGVELNPANVARFKERTMPEFQATWEKAARFRQQTKEDQAAEANLILRLRLLKAGKEVMRSCERLAQSNPTGHPAGQVESVIAHDQPVEDWVDVEAGEITRPTARLTLLATLASEAQDQLRSELQEMFSNSPFPGLSLDIELGFADPTSAEDLLGPGEELLEFGQARSGAYTVPPNGRLFPARPRLLTTVKLPAPVVPAAETPLALARQAAERELLVRELDAGGSPLDVARRLGVHQSTLEALLVEHGLQREQPSFAIALPEHVLLDPA